jgi:hypothetical protein
MTTMIFLWLAATITATSPSLTDVTSAVNQANNGDTVKIPAGAASWPSTLTISKWLTLQGAGSNATVITFTYSNAGGSLDKGGIVMQGPGFNQIYDMQFKGVGGYTARPALVVWSGNMRVSRCAFVDCASVMRPAGPFGVVDHNSVLNCRGAFSTFGWGDGQYNWDHYYPISFSSTNYLFFEDNTIEADGNRLRTLYGDNSFVVSSSGQGSSYVSRYNTILGYNNAQLAPAWDWHGDSNDGTRGNTSAQVYMNKITLRDTASIGFLVAARGGQGLIYSNTITGGSVGPISVWEEWPQGTTVEGKLVHDYVTNQWQWANTVNGNAMTDTSCASSPQGCGMLDFHNAPYTGSYSQTYPHPLVSGTLPPEPSSGTIEADKIVYLTNAPIVLTFTGAPGSAKDWIGLYKVGAAPEAYLQWWYTDGTDHGTAGIKNGSVTFSQGFADVGNYEGRLYPDESFSPVLASTTFGVRVPPTNPPAPAGTITIIWSNLPPTGSTTITLPTSPPGKDVFRLP